MNWTQWALAFLATVAIETPIYVWALRRGLGFTGAAATAVALNSITHPLAWSAIAATRHPFPGVFLIVEFAVCIIEALLLWLLCGTRVSRRRLGLIETLAISLTANGFSAGIGLLL